MRYKTALILVSVIILGCSSTNQTTRYLSEDRSDNFLYQLVAQQPTEDTLQAILVNEAILRGGSEAIVKIGKMLGSDNEKQKAAALTALTSLNFYVMNDGMAEHREKYLSAIYTILKSNLDIAQKTRVINLLNTSGNDGSIPHLSPYLKDLDLYNPACQAIVSINTQQSGETLLKNLSQVPEQNQVSIIKSLGDLSFTPAAEEIMTYADESKPEQYRSVLYALANMGYPAASSLFETEQVKENPNAQDYFASLYLRWLKNIKNDDMAVTGLRKIIANKNGNYKPNSQIAALSELLKRLKTNATSDLIAFIKNGHLKSRIAALEMATKTEEKTFIAALVDLLKNSAPEIQADIIYTFGRRKFKSTYPVILDYLNADNKNVRISSINALAGYDENEQLTSLFLTSLSKNDDAEEIATLKNALLQISSDLYLADMASGMQSYSVKAKICALEILTDRKSNTYTQSILISLSDDSLPVRIAALKALESLAGPEEYERVLSHFIKCEEKTEQKAAADVVVAVASRIKDQDKRLEPIIRSYQSATSEQKIEMLPLLARIGGKLSLNFVLAETKNKDAKINDAAIRALTKWSGYEALEPLVELSGKTKNATHQVLAIRGALQILGENELGSNYEVNVCSRLLEMANREEEKVFILSALSAIRSEESLAKISEYITDRQLGDDASRAALNVATPDDERINLSTDKVASTLIQTWRGKSVDADSNKVPDGFVALFNGNDLSGWKGLVANPAKRAEMSTDELTSAQVEADKVMREHWRVIDGILCFDGKGQSLCTIKNYGNFELLVDWKIEKEGDSGLYLRGTPQVQIWDPKTNPVGSGGLYNNQKNPSIPLRIADNPVGEWNRFHIIMMGSRVTVYLNDILVVNDVIMENYWERDKPIYLSDAIELQAHHSPLYFKNIFIKELPEDEGFFDGELFNGSDLSGWELVGAKEGSWRAENSILLTEGKGGGWISTTREYADFELELEFRVPPDGNSGVFIRAPREGNPAYAGMEIQVLDDYADMYSDLNAWQYTGSIYAVQAPSKRMTKKANRWQKMKIICNGPLVNVFLNGEEIINANLINHMDKTASHPGLIRRKGFIGLQNHSTKVEYRNIRLKEIGN